MEFKVGDKVRVTESCVWRNGRGKVGDVINIDIASGKVQVKFGEDLEWPQDAVWLHTYSIEKIDSKEEFITALDEAKKLVYGERNQDYGNPWEDFERTSKMWSVILGTDVTPEQYALCMITVKISRLLNDPTKRDSWVDIAGYAECYNRLQQWRNENA